MKGLGCFAFLLLTAFVCAQNFDGYININYGFQPEGIEYINHDGNVGFLLSSLNSDAIYLCSDDGNCEIFSRGGDQFTSTVGLQIDYNNELLYVCNIDTFSNITDAASVVALNLKDGSVAWNSDLSKLGTKGAPKFVNDVSPPDSNGNIYVTESFQGLIFKISSSGKASIFVNNGTLISPQDALLLGANGIDLVSYLGDEYLLVGVSGLTPETSYLVRVPLSNPKKMAIVQITNGESVYSLDGLYYDAVAQNLYAVSNAANLIYKLASSDGWETASITGSIAPKCPGFPGSTVVHLDNNPNHVGSAYILCPDTFSQRGPYQIENIEFFDNSGSYFYYYYFYSVTNSASSVAYAFALAACVIALAL